MNRKPIISLSSATLFVRLLFLLLATVLATQFVTFALVLAMPTPLPPTTPLRTIVDALRTGVSPKGGLDITRGALPRDDWTDPSELRMAGALASSLGVHADRIRMVSLRAMPSGLPARPGPAQADSVILPAPASARFDNQSLPNANLEVVQTHEVQGRFEAALRLSDGSWRIVSLVNEPIEIWQWQVLIWLLSSLLVVAPFAWFFAKRVADPIAAFGAAASRLGRDPTGVPITISGPPEIVAASRAVNDMQVRLSRYVEDRTTMVGAIAHDLRTPLMRLSLRLQKAPEDLREASEADIQEIEDMANSALSFVRDLTHQQDRHRVALRSVIETVVDDFADRGANVVLEAGDDVTLLADHNALKRMMDNLVGNALVYGGTAVVKLLATSLTATIVVTDTGLGIAPDQLDRVFDPFYRIEKSRNRHTGGTGLGLASARAVARGHGGDIVLTNCPEGGLLASVSLPL